MTLDELIEKLQALKEREEPEPNALGCDPVAIRVDLGPDQEFEIEGVSVDCNAFADDWFVVIEAGLQVGLQKEAQP